MGTTIMVCFHEKTILLAFYAINLFGIDFKSMRKYFTTLQSVFSSRLKLIYTGASISNLILYIQKLYVMSEPDLSGVPVTALESLRLRLAQLTHSLNSMLAHIQQATLPSWPALQEQFNVILTQLTSLAATIHGYADTLQRTVAYPLTNFPTNTQMGLLTTLLRKKNLPEVQEWIVQGRAAGNEIKVKQDADFCGWAAKIVDTAREHHEWSGFLTREQIENDQQDDGMARRNVDEDGWSPDEVIIYLSRGELPERYNMPPQI
jgi:mediator of RNA polymerase II transcription subunit 8